MAFSHWARYWIYYKPLYTIFENSIYLPFYLHAASILILFGGLFIVNLKFECKVYTKIIWVLIVGTGLFFIGRNIYKDIIFMNTKKYLTVECNLNTLRSYRSRRNKYYEIYSTEKINGKTLSVKMDFYQYNKLLNERKENKNRIIKIHYLPNTKRMLIYE
jgi:hypothetical protein